jgi:hypothetical protein
MKILHLVLSVYSLIAVVVALLVLLVWFVYRDEPELRAECEARGGVLISARSPLYVCVQPK